MRKTKPVNNVDDRLIWEKDGAIIEQWVITDKFVALSGGKLGIECAPYSEDKARIAEKSMCIGISKYNRRLSVGAVYDIPTKREQKNGEESISLYTGWASWRQMHPDNELVAGWRLQAKAKETSIKLKRQEKSETGVNYISKVLAPLSRIYNKTDALGKICMEAQILAALRQVKVDR